MDEVDGMSSSDRGGNQALIQVIKKSRTPIICICNDRYVRDGILASMEIRYADLI